MNECTIPGCIRPRKGRGLCNMHYQRWRAHPDRYNAPPPRDQPCPTHCTCTTPTPVRVFVLAVLCDRCKRPIWLGDRFMHPEDIR